MTTTEPVESRSLTGVLAIVALILLVLIAGRLLLGQSWAFEGSWLVIVALLGAASVWVDHADR